MPDRDMAILQEGAMKAFIDVVGRYECRFKYMHYGNNGVKFSREGKKSNRFLAKN